MTKDTLLGLIIIAIVIAAVIATFFLMQTPPKTDTVNGNHTEDNQIQDNTPSERKIVTDTRYWLLEAKKQYEETPEGGGIMKTSTKTYQLNQNEIITVAEIIKGTSINANDVSIQCSSGLECNSTAITVKSFMVVEIQAGRIGESYTLRYVAP